MPPDPTAYLTSIRTDTAALAATLDDTTLDIAVPSCPGWTLRDLAHHLGYVQRWARLAATTGRQPDDDAIDDPPLAGPDEAAALRAWLVGGADDLVAALARIDPAAPTWHPFPVPRVAAVWPRRQAHEVAVHRWDAQHAVGAAPTAMPLADDFVAEYFEVIVPRVVDRDGRTPPVGLLDVTLADSTYRVDSAAGWVGFGPRPASGAADAEITGAAEDVVLALWRRAPLPTAPTSPLAAEWLAFGGN